jgi:hypothetical protein
MGWDVVSATRSLDWEAGWSDWRAVQAVTAIAASRMAVAMARVRAMVLISSNSEVVEFHCLLSQGLVTEGDRRRRVEVSEQRQAGHDR